MTYTLEPTQYWKLRALVSENQRFAAAATLAQQKQDALVAILGAQYGFNPKVPSFSMDDEACTLTLPEADPPTK